MLGSSCYDRSDVFYVVEVSDVKLLIDVGFYVNITPLWYYIATTYYCTKVTLTTISDCVVLKIFDVFLNICQYSTQSSILALFNQYNP